MCICKYIDYVILIFLYGLFLAESNQINFQFIKIILDNSSEFIYKT